MNRFSKPQQKLLAPGFTLLELIVSMSVTLFIVGGLVAVTSSALDTFRNSTNNVRSYKQAKTAIDQLSQDLEAIVMATYPVSNMRSLTRTRSQERQKAITPTPSFSIAS